MRERIILRVIIIGAGGHGQVVADILLAVAEAGGDIDLAGYLDDDAALHGKILLERPVLGPVNSLGEIEHDGVIVAIGDNRTRQRVFDMLEARGAHPVTACHPRAAIARGVSVGDGCAICAGVVVNPGSVVGKNVILNTGCTVDHHNVIGDHAHIAPGAHLGGGVNVGEGALIGMGATVLPGMAAGNWCAVGAGACVTRPVPDGQTVRGVPARPCERGMEKRTPSRIYLSPPHMSGREQAYIREAFDTNWIAPLGPNVDAFEREFREALGVGHAAALSSGTAALHLALRLAGVGPGDEVLVSTLTFCASVNPILYVGARPVFVDSDEESWNMDPGLFEAELNARAARGALPKAVVLVHLYGQSADLDPLLESSRRYGVPLIEDAAESLGATYKGRQTGSFGLCGVFSFNGNKIVNTSGGGMLVSEDGAFIDHARKLATQARDPAPHYEHTEIGYNYRMSNVLAGIGRAQLEVLPERVEARRRNFAAYAGALADVPGLTFMPEPAWGRATRWLTCVLIEPSLFGADRERIRLALEEENIEARPLWKPMHMQPVYAGHEAALTGVAERLFARGLCLPSGSSLSDADRDRVIHAIRTARERG